MNYLFYLIGLLCAYVMSHADTRTDRKSHKETEHEICKRARASDCRNGNLAAILSYYDKVRGVV